MCYQNFKMAQNNHYQTLKKLIEKNTSERLGVIKEELASLGLKPTIYSLDSPRGVDVHLSVAFNYNHKKELWLTANYDTFERMPSANNNSSGVITLLGLSEKLIGSQFPVNIRLIYFDAGLDTDLIAKNRRNPEFKPGSELFLEHILNKEIEFIDSYNGTIIVQAVGKGNFQVFEKTGKKYENSQKLNKLIINHAKSKNITIPLLPNSPNADNISFLKLGLEASVLTRYDEGSWHKMQTTKDDISNVNINLINQNIKFILGLLQNIENDR